ncbi:MAG: Flp pilus assembly complex ATPase component TadA [Treponema sp.]|uniref:ATPase, T2SS/T4P/T4SS family n=1 Tax=Treponema sp. TaxID=166 RepID=UPI00298E6C3C|nr:ATPase, T2SS/T4P/T4SS family [Treponema sp.]MCQ2596553.1 Flp pilus assembly complex ATPase component TadA [Treponema sp.]MCQ2601098.1 Flp pilus assembly complex ATPase component TadA [Treponema sp.]
MADFTPQTPEEIRLERQIDNLLRDDMKVFIPFLEDDKVTDISVPDSGELVVSKFGEGRIFTGIQVPSYIVERILKATSSILGRTIDFNSHLPILEGIIPKYNARITGLTRINCNRYELEIRKPSKIIYSLENYVESKRMTESQYEEIINTIQKRGNIIISGTTGSGKTTMTNAIIKKMAEFTPKDNFLLIEDTLELQCDAIFKRNINIYKEDAHLAVEAAMRLSPDRIIFGEVRTGIVMRALLDAWRTHSGNCTTMHATDGTSTLLRIKSMIGTEDIDMANHLSEVIALIVHLKKGLNGPVVDELFHVNDDTDDFLAGIVSNNLG